jgi:hypothetical protein
MRDWYPVFAATLTFAVGTVVLTFFAVVPTAQEVPWLTPGVTSIGLMTVTILSAIIETLVSSLFPPRCGKKADTRISRVRWEIPTDTPITTPGVRFEKGPFPPSAWDLP